IYINEAFTIMTGYTAGEVINQSPQFLKGPKTDPQEINRINNALDAGESCEGRLINYKKSGEEFWANFSISPVVNQYNEVTHFIAIERDVTQWVNKELQKTLLSDVSQAFNRAQNLSHALNITLEDIARFGDFLMAEIWLVSVDKCKINFEGRYANPQIRRQLFGVENHFAKGKGLPGKTWAAGEVTHWKNFDGPPDFLVADEAGESGIRTAYGVPLIAGNQVVGVLIVGVNRNETFKDIYTSVFNELGHHLGIEIRRKQMEYELHQIFNAAPDVICIVGTDRAFKSANPAMCQLFGYTHEEILAMKIDDLIHPDELATSKARMADFIKKGDYKLYFECRYITRAGRVKWLAWTATTAAEKGLLFCIAKDITEKKELEVLLNKATTLAGIGGWEIDLVKQTIYWSPVTCEIHEVGVGYNPDFINGITFYKGAADKAKIEEELAAVAGKGAIIDVELEIVTAKHNSKWIRVIGEGEFANGRCIRISGSFQDIDLRKKAELAAIAALAEKDIILESIDDAFFAVDKNWVVTYWNNTAAQMLGKSKQQMLNNKLWDVFSDSVDSLSFKKYHEALESNQVVQFEDYYPPVKKWYEISAYPSADGLSVYFKDVTDRVNYVKAIEEQNTRLTEISWLQSHVIRAPLSRIMGLVQLVKAVDLKNSENQQIFEYLQSSADELDGVIKDIIAKTDISAET
ncbi:MAG TPA: PAS domain S-box protein, partial [Mucilaginibacter sp.]